jgi:hypothetical protein
LNKVPPRVLRPDGKPLLEIENLWSENCGASGFSYIDEEADCGIDGMLLLPKLPQPPHVAQK